jgi:hypothetical protein
MSRLINEAMSWANRLDSDQWLIVLIVVTVIGAWCMRGFGSRAKY